MKPYIANAAKQHQIFAYRKIEAGRLIQIPIDRGNQMMVLDGTTEGVSVVVQHHQVYGLVDSAKIDQSQALVDSCYSLGRPISASVVEEVVHDDDIHLTHGARGHHQASVAVLDSSPCDSGAGYSREMGVSAEQAKGQGDNEDTPAVNETIVTEKTGSEKK